MKQVIYQGEGATIGRFGAVKKGQKLELYEYEFQGIKDDPAFKDVSVKLSAEELEIAQRIKPLGCKTFDLRTIPWEKRTIAKLITARFSKTSLIRVINAINEVGGVIDVNTAHVSRNGLVDIILCAASTMGWNKLSKHERLSLGLLVASLPLLRWRKNHLRMQMETLYLHPTRNQNQKPRSRPTRRFGNAPRNRTPSS